MQDSTQRQASSFEPSEAPKQSSMQDQAIFVYPDRIQILLDMVWFIIAAFIILFATYHRFGINLYNISSVVLVSIVLITLLVFIVFTIVGTVWLLYSRNPLLIINHEGITVGRRGLFQRRFTPWNQIEAIYVYTSHIHTYFCIRPKDSKRFLRRSHMLERWIRRDNEKYGVAVESITQAALEMPVDEILQCLATYYSYELNTYHIQLHP